MALKIWPEFDHLIFFVNMQMLVKTVGSKSDHFNVTAKTVKFQKFRMIKVTDDLSDFDGIMFLLDQIQQHAKNEAS